MVSSNEECSFAEDFALGRRLPLFGLRHQEKMVVGLRVVSTGRGPGGPRCAV